MNAVRLRSAAVAAVAAVLLIALSGCKADPVPGQTPAASGASTPSASASITPTPAPSASATPSTTPSPTPTPTAAPFALPGDCAAIYSPAMLSTLQADGGPLNDPGLSMGATNVEAAYAVLEQATAAGESLRCTWGVPSEVGLATQVSVVDGGQADAVITALQSHGLTCDAYQSGTLCRIVVESSEEEGGHVWGETHFLEGNAWVATSWINFGPVGYTEDIVTTLWG